jgi:hypothetical protein
MDGWQSNQSINMYCIRFIKLYPWHQHGTPDTTTHSRNEQIYLAHLIILLDNPSKENQNHQQTLFELRIQQNGQIFDFCILKIRNNFIILQVKVYSSIPFLYNYLSLLFSSSLYPPFFIILGSIGCFRTGPECISKLRACP